MKAIGDGQPSPEVVVLCPLLMETSHRLYRWRTPVIAVLGALSGATLSLTTTPRPRAGAPVCPVLRVRARGRQDWPMGSKTSRKLSSAFCEANVHALRASASLKIRLAATAVTVGRDGV